MSRILLLAGVLSPARVLFPARGVDAGWYQERWIASGRYADWHMPYTGIRTWRAGGRAHDRGMRLSRSWDLGIRGACESELTKGMGAGGSTYHNDHERQSYLPSSGLQCSRIAVKALFDLNDANTWIGWPVRDGRHCSATVSSSAVQCSCAEPTPRRKMNPLTPHIQLFSYRVIFGCERTQLNIGQCLRPEYSPPCHRIAILSRPPPGRGKAQVGNMCGRLQRLWAAHTIPN